MFRVGRYLCTAAILLMMSQFALARGADKGCTCAPQRTQKQWFEDATSVFAGQVVDIRRGVRRDAKSTSDGSLVPSVESLTRRVTVTCFVYKSWKGSPCKGKKQFSSTTFTTTIGPEELCGINLEVGQKYLFFTEGIVEEKVGNACSSRFFPLGSQAAMDEIDFIRSEKAIVNKERKNRRKKYED